MLRDIPLVFFLTMVGTFGYCQQVSPPSPQSSASIQNSTERSIPVGRFDLIPPAILLNVVLISPDFTGDQNPYSTGTGFFVGSKGLPYLVTAKHVLGGTQDHEKKIIWIKAETSWVVLSVEVNYSPNSDVAVLKVLDPVPTVKFKGLELCRNQLTLGEPGIFLGFPYGMYTDPFAKKPDSDHPFKGRIVPFVKHAYLSGSIPSSDDSPLGGMMVLDGLNNEGFSGGPVLFHDDSVGLCVAGVVSSYRYMNAHVYDKDSNETENSVRANTGLMYASYSGQIANVIASIESKILP
jgi:S1-C subfamily serine protease